MVTAIITNSKCNICICSSTSLACTAVGETVLTSSTLAFHCQVIGAHSGLDSSPIEEHFLIERSCSPTPPVVSIIDF